MLCIRLEQQFVSCFVVVQLDSSALDSSSTLQTRSSGFGIGPAIPFLPSLSPFPFPPPFPSFPLPFPPLSSPPLPLEVGPLPFLSFPFPPLPLEVGPLNPARRSGELVGSGAKPQPTNDLVHIWAKGSSCGGDSFMDFCRNKFNFLVTTI